MSPVLLVIDNLEFGGGERGFLQLVRALAAEGWPLGVAAGPGGPFEAGVRAAGVPFFPLGMGRRAALAAVGALRRLAGRFAIVHSQGARADFLTRLALLRLPGVRHVCTLQMPVEGFDVGPLRRAVYTALDRLSARRVDRFIVVSRALQGLVHRRGVAPERVRLIYNGVEVGAAPDPAARARAAAALRAALGLPAGGPLLGAAGRLVWQKGFEDLVRAMPAVLRRVPEARLVIAGDGPLRAGLAALAREAAVADRVTLAGFQADVPAFLRGLDVLVVPSRREGFPMITLEAMALGTPVVATALEGIVEQVEDEVEGLLVPPGAPAALAAAVGRLLGDASLRARLAGAAWARVATAFDVRATVAATKAVYAEVGAPSR